MNKNVLQRGRWQGLALERWRRAWNMLEAPAAPDVVKAASSCTLTGSTVLVLRLFAIAIAMRMRARLFVSSQSSVHATAPRCAS